MSNNRASLSLRLTLRVSVTVIFAAATVLGFALGRPVFAVIMLAFLAVSCAMLASLLRERSASKR